MDSGAESTRTWTPTVGPAVLSGGREGPRGSLREPVGAAEKRASGLDFCDPRRAHVRRERSEVAFALGATLHGGHACSAFYWPGIASPPMARFVGPSRSSASAHCLDGTPSSGDRLAASLSRFSSAACFRSRLRRGAAQEPSPQLERPSTRAEGKASGAEEIAAGAASRVPMFGKPESWSVSRPARQTGPLRLRQGTERSEPLPASGSGRGSEGSAHKPRIPSTTASWMVPRICGRRSFSRVGCTRFVSSTM